MKNNELYLVYNDGRVFSKKNNKFKKIYTKNGYEQISINSKDFSVHRLVAELFVENKDPINNIYVDHIDRNRSNNHYTNLRWVTKQQNNQNKTIHKNNKTGYIGIGKLKNGKYEAYIFINGKKKHIGSYDDCKKALTDRVEAELKYYGEFCNKHNLSLLYSGI